MGPHILNTLLLYSWDLLIMQRHCPSAIVLITSHVLSCLTAAYSTYMYMEPHYCSGKLYTEHNIMLSQR